MTKAPVKNKKDEAAAYDAAQKVVEVHRRLAAHLRAGQTLAEIDAFVGKTLDDIGCKSCFFRYSPGRLPPFPSQACLSVNECVVHGTAGYYPAAMKRGDVLKIDIGVSYRGWIGDAAWTYVFGEPTKKVRELCSAGKAALAAGIEQIAPDTPLVEWARACQNAAESEAGFHLVEGLGGHGYGRSLHSAPFVSNVVPRGMFEWPDGKRCPSPGTLLALEPMLAVGTGETRQDARKWPIFSADGSMTVHYEHDVLVTDSGHRVLSEGLEALTDVIDCD